MLQGLDRLDHILLLYLNIRTQCEKHNGVISYSGTLPQHNCQQQLFWCKCIIITIEDLTVNQQIQMSTKQNMHYNYLVSKSSFSVISGIKCANYNVIY